MGVLSTLQHCLDLMSSETECWKRKLDKEKNRKENLASKYSPTHDFLYTNVFLVRHVVGEARRINRDENDFLFIHRVLQAGK